MKRLVFVIAMIAAQSVFADTDDLILEDLNSINEMTVSVKSQNIKLNRENSFQIESDSQLVVVLKSNRRGN